MAFVWKFISLMQTVAAWVSDRLEFPGLTAVSWGSTLPMTTVVSSTLTACSRTISLGFHPLCKNSAPVSRVGNLHPVPASVSLSPQPQAVMAIISGYAVVGHIPTRLMSHTDTHIILKSAVNWTVFKQNDESLVVNERRWYRHRWWWCMWFPIVSLQLVIGVERYGTVREVTTEM